MLLAIMNADAREIAGKRYSCSPALDNVLITISFSGENIASIIPKQKQSHKYVNAGRCSIFLTQMCKNRQKAKYPGNRRTATQKKLSRTSIAIMDGVNI
jgi:hypothetical protein